jgi:neopullulanase
MRKFFCLAIAIACSVLLNAQEYKVTGVYPTHWWVGMKNSKLQIMLRGANIAENTITVSYPGVQLQKVHKVDNKNYVFLDLNITPGAKPGTMQIRLRNPNGTGTVAYTLKPRKKGKGTEFAQGITAADFVYLIMPDRFSNGDPSNDRVPGMRDQSLKS